jgi:hypothetical protein
MKKQESQVVRELGKFVQAFWLELPMAAANRFLGNGNETTLRKARWKAYDAFVSLANEATNTIYANPVVGALTGQTMEQALQIQHVGSAAASAFFGNLWPAVGLPTADAVAGLRNEIAALHEDLSQAVEATAEDEQAQSPMLAATSSEGLSLLRNGYLKRDEREDDEDAAA